MGGTLAITCRSSAVEMVPELSCANTIPMQRCQCQYLREASNNGSSEMKHDWTLKQAQHQVAASTCIMEAQQLKLPRTASAPQTIN